MLCNNVGIAVVGAVNVGGNVDITSVVVGFGNTEICKLNYSSASVGIEGKAVVDGITVAEILKGGNRFYNKVCAVVDYALGGNLNRESAVCVKRINYATLEIGNSRECSLVSCASFKLSCLLLGEGRQVLVDNVTDKSVLCNKLGLLGGLINTEGVETRGLYRGNRLVPTVEIRVVVRLVLCSLLRSKRSIVVREGLVKNLYVVVGVVSEYLVDSRNVLGNLGSLCLVFATRENL